MYEVWHGTGSMRVLVASFVEKSEAELFVDRFVGGYGKERALYEIRDTTVKPPAEEAPFLRVKVTETSCARAFAGGHVLLSERSENDGAEKYAIVIEGRELTLTRAEVVVFRRMVEETFPWQVE